MNFKKFLDPHPLHPIQMGFFILIELLLIFGKEFTKFHLFGPFHLYDFLLLLLTFFSFFVILRKKQLVISVPLVLLIVFGITYLVYSFLGALGPVNYIIRQFALFVYLICTALIFSSYINEKNNDFNIRFMVLIGFGSIIVQIVYVVYAYFFIEGFNFFARNYFSFMAIMGVITVVAYLMVYYHNNINKILLLLFVYIVTITFGHASAFLACFTIVFAYLFLKGKLYFKIIVTVALLASVWAFFNYYPEFTDFNAQWRMVYWKETMKNLTLSNYGIIGNGFGVPFVEQNLIEVFKEMESGWYEYRPEEIFLTPMHNSFITIFFHVGILPGLLVFYAIRKPILYLFKRDEYQPDKEKDFLVLTGIGLTIWSGFNVILELPHSSAFFWLVVLTTLYKFKEDKKRKAGSFTIHQI